MESIVADYQLNKFPFDMFFILFCVICCVTFIIITVINVLLSSQNNYIVYQRFQRSMSLEAVTVCLIVPYVH